MQILIVSKLKLNNLRLIIFSNIFNNKNIPLPHKFNALPFESNLNILPLRKGVFSLFLLFFIRILLLIIAIIIMKSLFLCWYLEIWSLDQFFENISSLSSALISIGVFTGNFMDFILKKTSLNINLLNLWDILWFNNSSNSKLDRNFFNPAFFYIDSDQELPNKIKCTELSKSSYYSSTTDNKGIGSSAVEDSINIKSLDKLLEEQRKILHSIESELKTMKNSSSEKDVSKRINDIIDLFNRIQALRTDLIAQYGKHVSSSTAVKLNQSINSLGSNYNELQKSLNAIGQKETKNKIEFDIYSKYMKQNNLILSNAVKECLSDIKLNKPGLFEQMNTPEFKKHINNLDLNQKELKDLKKETFLVLNQKKK